MHTTFDVFDKIKKEVDNFYTSKVNIVEPTTNGLKQLKKSGGYSFSQHKTLEDIDLIIANKYRTGEKDEEGQQKLFLNTVDFILDVARKNIDIDVKNFVFRPDNKDVRAICIQMSKDFSLWSKKNNYGEIINEFVDDLPKYGTVVSKRVGKTIVRIPLKQILITQSAKSIKEAICNDGYFIQKHELSYYEVKKFKDWKVEEFEGTKLFYERYGLLPKSFIDGVNGIQSNDNTKVESVVIICLDTQEVAFCEEIDESPYDECHWERVDNRWLGRGEVEKQFENQKAMNLIANLQRRGMLWSSKKIFQTSGDGVARNLIKEVRDGEVMEVGRDGTITQINMQNQASGDFQQAMNLWSKNAQDKSFTFEVATGEAMPSGTPFRLGVVLSQSAQLHYNRKREKLGLFLQNIFYHQLVPIFKKQVIDHTMYFSPTESGFNLMKKVISDYYRNQYYIKQMNSKDMMHVPTYEEVQNMVNSKIEADQGIFIDVMKGAYDDVYTVLELDVTGESRDIEGEMTTLSTIYEILSGKGDPRADSVLDEILSLTGKSLPYSNSQTNQIVQNKTPQKPDLTALTQQYAGGNETSAL